MNNEELLERKRTLEKELAEINQLISSNKEMIKHDLLQKISTAKTTKDAIMYCTSLRLQYESEFQFALAIHDYNYAAAYNHLINLEIHAPDTSFEFSKFVHRIEDYVHCGFIPLLG